MRLGLIFSLIFASTSCSDPVAVSGAVTAGTSKASVPSATPAAAGTVDPATAGAPAAVSPVTISSPAIVDSERADIPVQVNGTYLSCNVFSKASDFVSQASLACRFEDLAKQRVDPASIGTNFNYTISSTPVADVTSSLKVVTRVERSYEVNIELTGNVSNETINQAATALRLQASFRDLQGQDQQLGSSSPSMNPLPASTNNWVRTVADGLSSYVDTYRSKVSGLLWFDQCPAAYAFPQADSACANAVTHNWRLPTFAEYRAAHATGMFSTQMYNAWNFPKFGQTANVNYWSSTDGSQVPAPTKRVFIPSEPDAHGGFVPTQTLYCLCVTDE